MMWMLKALLPYALLAFAISATLYPLVKITAKRFKWMDIPEERKIHKVPLPRIGGVMIFISFIITALIYKKMNPQLAVLHKYFSELGFILSATAAFLLGFIDDIIGIRALKKLILQFAIGLTIAFSGLIIDNVTVLGIQIHLGLFSYALTAIWVVALINAVNLMDGMDGLASGIMIISLIFTFWISTLEGNYFVTTLSGILIGSIFGFYIFNFPKAKIFMGDSGSYFLGCMYSMIAMMGMKKTSMAIMMAIPLVLLLIPIADVIYITVRRTKRHQGIFHADKNHIHHRLLSLGFNTMQINFLMYLVCTVFGLIALLIALTGGRFGLLFFFLIICLVIAGFAVVRILERR
ncbi:MAG: MraY family glycosyltransferase [Proteobacteria bacterium]|nr:MraY family glycosyltransferase [Pseudomonadota bacterium]